MRYSKTISGGAVVLAALCLAAATMAAEKAGSPPDFTGVWTNGGAAGIGGATNANAGALPFTPAAQKRVDAFRKLTAGTDESPGRWCTGTGMPGSMLGSGGYPMEIVQRPEEIVIIYEAHSETRRVYFGARNAPEKDRVADRGGYSSGHWEGDTLVVETDNLVDQLDQRTPHSEDATIVERYKLGPKDAQGRRTLIAEMVMTDPKFYSTPVKLTKTWAEVPNGRILPYDCPAEMWNDRIEELAKKAGVPLP